MMSYICICINAFFKTNKSKKSVSLGHVDAETSSFKNSLKGTFIGKLIFELVPLNVFY